MQKGARDFRSGQEFGHANFFDEAVDIHHIFPKKWCVDNGKDPKEYDSIVNKSPLSSRTNRIIGGVAPSIYLKSLEEGSHEFQSVPVNDLNRYLQTHAADPDHLRDDNYEAFLKARQKTLLSLIENAMKKTASSQGVDEGSWGDAGV
ncbi:MAG: hypothetical protein COB16_19475 [Rhodobacteraceae bacterium]|nr:MAG: hypothetical protein COB16_19475 [Paracoccaceae bacterium]